MIVHVYQKNYSTNVNGERYTEEQLEAVAIRATTFFLGAKASPIYKCRYWVRVARRKYPR